MPGLRKTCLEDLEDVAVSDQVHGDRLCTALLHRRRDSTEDRARGLSRLVPALDFLSGQRIDNLNQVLEYPKGSMKGSYLRIEVEFPLSILGEELSRSFEGLIAR
jgi:hypothetical protein